MTLRIIDNKKIELTESEFTMYQELVKAYTTQTMSGEEYFKDLFETDKKGIIVFIRPPSKTYSSMECFMFIVVVMVHQYLRSSCNEATRFFKEAEQTIITARQIANEAKQIALEAKNTLKEIQDQKKDI